jgi:tol-pal system protein YbgF
MLGLCAAPGVAALFDDNEARRQISVERKRLDDLAGRVGAQEKSVEASLKAINDRMGRLEESMKGQALLDLFREIENLKAEIAKMRGQMEVIANSVEVNQKRQRDFYVDLDSRLRRLEAPPASPATGASSEPPAASGTPSGQVATAAAGTAKPTVPPPAVAADPSEARIYETAQNLRRIGNYQGAINAFQEFIRRYPKSTLASSAQYWIGDSYFNLRDFRLAIQSQRSLISLYPDSQKVPDALLNIASSQIEMGESVAGRRTMEEVVNKYPVSEAADKAKRRLATLK